jgi:hypothetical protein
MSMSVWGQTRRFEYCQGVSKIVVYPLDFQKNNIINNIDITVTIR